MCNRSEPPAEIFAYDTKKELKSECAPQDNFENVSLAASSQVANTMPRESKTRRSEPTFEAHS